MDKAIILVTYPKSPFLKRCLKALQPCDYPIHLCINPEEDCPYDPGAFYYARKHDIKEFIILHDSMIMKDLSLFDEAFSLEGNVSIGDNFLMCFGKFELDKLPELPRKPVNKGQAVAFEAVFLRSITPDHTLCREFRDGNTFVNKYGRKRMVIENDYLIKYKATWRVDMI